MITDLSVLDEDFHKARRTASIQSVFDKMRWRNPNLLSLYDVTALIKPKSQTYKGFQTIRVDHIIGSEGRAHDFSSAFFPKRDSLKTRWVSIDLAYHEDIQLPPISVYSINGWYFVRDGNHRVSVARAQGVEFVDAEVVELDSEIAIDSRITIEELKARVVSYERNRFLTLYTPSYLPMGNIVFTSVGAYPELVNHILVHKYYINQTLDYEISFEEAAKSWYTNVYKPIVDVIREEKLLSEFPGYTEGDMYLWLVRKWDEDKQVNAQADLHETAKKIHKKKKKSFIRKIVEKLKIQVSRSETK